MENYSENKLGGGIITICVLQIIGNALGLLLNLAFIISRDTIEDFYSTYNIALPSNSLMIISLLSSIVLLVSIIFILMKNKVGVYIYFTITILSIIYTIISLGFSASIITSLILPILMAVFISSKKEVFGLNS